VTRPRIEELLAAYASGAELPDDERAAVEALLDQSPAAKREVDAIGALLCELRATEPEPPPASEAVVRAVRIACATPEPGLRGWLARRWRIAVPAVLAAGAAAAIAITLAGRGGPGPTEVAPAPPIPIPTTSPDVDDGGGEPTTDAVWLDGAAFALGDLDDETAAELDRMFDDELAAFDAGDDADEPVFDGLLPDDALDWVDALDDADAEMLDAWLAEHPS
jgi:hypothetical protein